jgi:hypothetical protein
LKGTIFQSRRLPWKQRLSLKAAEGGVHAEKMDKINIFGTFSLKNFAAKLI